MNFGADFADFLITAKSRRRSLAGASAPWQDAFLPDPKLTAHSVAPGRPWRLLPFWLLLVATTVVLLGRLYDLQLVHGRENLTLSEVNRVLPQIVKPERGVIFDRNGTVLARNQPGFSVVLNLKEVPPQDLRPLPPGLAKLLSLGEDEVSERIRKALAEGKEAITIKSGVDRDTILRLEANANLFSGISTAVGPVREYVDGEVFSHILGFVGEADREDLARLRDLNVSGGDKVGQSDLEFAYEPVLRGEAGERLIEVDAFGYQFRLLSEKAAVSGDSLVLTIDASLQKAVFEALSSGIQKSGASGGAAVVQDVRTGEILALVSLPSFDPNLFSKGISESAYQTLLLDPKKPLFNRAISGAFPPGSTFKVVIATAALEEGVITPQTVIDDKGSISVGGLVFKGWAPEGLGPVSLKTAIAKSSDIYFYTVGGGYGGQRGLGVEKIAEWARRFGLGQGTGVALSAETGGLVPDPAWRQETYDEPWYIGHTYNISIGQGDLLVTPLQLNNLVVAIANGGTLFRPRLVKQILAAEGQILQGFESEVLRSSLASPSALTTVREGMRAACQPGGTAYPLFDFKVPVAGKTGTSETGKKDKTHAWFTAFAPYDKPEIAVTVFLEEGGEGSRDAAPVVREILEAYFSD